MCIVRERHPAGFLDMKCQTCFPQPLCVKGLVSYPEPSPRGKVGKSYFTAGGGLWVRDYKGIASNYSAHAALMHRLVNLDDGIE